MTQPSSTQPAEPEAPGDFVVVGVDGSASSMNALRWAAFQAEVLGCSLVAVAAWRNTATYAGAVSGGWVAMPSDWNAEQSAETALAASVDEALGDRRPGSLRTVVAQGGAAEVLLAESRDARLLVVGSRGHGGFAGLLLGSVSTACAEHAQCPVLVVHGDTLPSRSGA